MRCAFLPLLLLACGGADGGFGTKGHTLLDFGCAGQASRGESVAKTKTGWVAGGVGCDSWVVAGFLPDGRLDPTFGVNGRVEAGLSTGQVDVLRLWVRPDGRVLAQVYLDGVHRVRAFSASGRPETAFDDAIAEHLPGSFEAAMAPDGKLVVALGTMVRRFGLDGSLDPTFGKDGEATVPSTSSSASVSGVAVGPDGAVVIVQGAGHDAIIKLTPAGAVDLAFGQQGVFPVLDMGVIVWTLAVQDDGGVLFAGSAHSATNTSRPTLWRLTPAGALDPAFGDQGRADAVHSAERGHIASVVPLADGRFFAAATVSTSNRMGWAVGRYLANGEPDPAFHGSGLVWIDLGPSSNVGGASSLAVDDEGVVVVGTARDFTSTQFALARVSN